MENNFNVINSTINNVFISSKDRCISCKKCLKVCPFLEKYCNTPKELLINIEKTTSIDPIVPFSCSLCGCCKRVCPKNIDLGEVFFTMREEISTYNGGKSPLKGHSVMHFHQSFSNSPLFKGIYGDKKVKRLFMPGCSLSGYDPELVIKIYNYLNEKLGHTGLLLYCCSKPTKDLGEIDLFRKRYESFINEVKSFENVEIITACQSCFRVLKEESTDIKTTSLWKVLKEIDIPKDSIGKGKDCKLEFSIKDSCQSLDDKEIGESIRYIINRLGYNLKSLDFTNSCCGFGGLVHTVDSNLSKAIRNSSLEKLESNNIISYCGGCLGSVNLTDKRSYHILDLIFKDKNEIESRNKLNITTLNSWKNRYKLKSKMKHIKRDK